MGGFGDFSSICNEASIPLCSVVGANSTGIEPACYARSIEWANTIIFQAATSFVHIAALTMTVIMILHVRGKFTAVGMSPIRRPPDLECALYRGDMADFSSGL